jgi:ubiquinol-cytochrome c reductase iron-sulfur subunit
MMAETDSAGQEPDRSRRHFLYISTATLGVVGAGLAVWPFVDAMNPAGDLRKYDAVVDLTAIPEGGGVTIVWQGKPVFVRHRTQAEIDAARNIRLTNLRDPERDADRVLKPEWLVVVGICTFDRRCIPVINTYKAGRDNFGGWYCPCCTARYDTSGRVGNSGAAKNLRVPRYEFLDERTIGLRSTEKPPSWPS